MNKLYFDGELDFKTKAGLKEGMSKEKSNAENGTQEKVHIKYLSIGVSIHTAVQSRN